MVKRKPRERLLAFFCVLDRFGSSVFLYQRRLCQVTKPDPNGFLCTGVTDLVLFDEVAVVELIGAGPVFRIQIFTT